MNPAKEQKLGSKLMQNVTGFVIAIFFAAFVAGCAGNSDRKTSEEEQPAPSAEAIEASEKTPPEDAPAASKEETAAAGAQPHATTAWPTGSLAGAAEEPAQPVAAADQSTETKPAEEVEELPKREVRDAYQQNPTRWINEEWKNRTTWPHAKTELESEAVVYAKKNYLSLYLKDAKAETVIDANAQVGTVTFNRGKGKSALRVVFGSSGKPERHYFQVL